MSPASRYQQLLDSIQEEFPSFHIEKKPEHTFWRVLDFFVKVFTFGKNKEFMTSYTTTIGTRIGVPVDWDSYQADQKWGILMHEREHMRDCKRWTTVLFSLIWLIFPVPLFFAWGRTAFEKRGYAKTLLVAYVLFGCGGKDTWGLFHPDFKKAIVEQFTTGQYGWMWVIRKHIESWYDRTAKSVIH